MTEVLKSFIQLSSARFEPGYWFGLGQSSVLVNLRLMHLEIPEMAVSRFDVLMSTFTTKAELASSRLLINSEVVGNEILNRVLCLTIVLLKKMGMPVMGGATALMPVEKSEHDWVVGIPAIAHGIRAPQAAFSLACSLMNVVANGKSLPKEMVASSISKLLKQYRPLAPAGINTLRFLEAAHDMGIPWRHVANNVYQFGWGSRSRWLDSSFTDETSSISAGLARDKVACSLLLRKLGLPVAKHQLVNTAEEAVKVADSMGYPVVIKPANLDGGTGVMAGVMDTAGVTRAFEIAAKHSKKILVEKFIDGEDYRIRICAGEVIGAVIRKAAAVMGDGQRSVRALIEKTNAERSQQLQPVEVGEEHGLKPIVVDEEVESWLRNQGMTLDSVVPLGQKVRLRGAANLNLGGTTWDVMLKAHPDNLALALRAAAALRLDVAGVDLLLPDIGQSWKVTGGAVCEVNAQPQFSSGDAHRQVLQRLVRHQGRIPVFGILKACLSRQVLLPLMQRLQKEGVRVEIASSDRQCHQALMNQHVDALIWLFDEIPKKKDALPVNEIDVLIRDSVAYEQPISVQWSIPQQWVLSESLSSEQMIKRLENYMFEVSRQSES
jgi:cyanophycin synthetase